MNVKCNNIISCNYGKCNHYRKCNVCESIYGKWQLQTIMATVTIMAQLMASFTYGKCNYGKCNYGNVFMAKVLWQMQEIAVIMCL